MISAGERIGMPLFACRWSNGDVSFVIAPNKETAIERLDEIANAEGCPIVAISEFQLHLNLTEEGGFAFEQFGEDTDQFVWERLYPRLYEAWLTVWEEQSKTNQDTLTPEQQARIRAAVEVERDRVQRKNVPEPETELGKDLRRVSDMPTTMINKIVREGATERLQKFQPPEGKKGKH